MILGVPKIEMPTTVCDTGLIGKQPRNAFSFSTAHRSKELLNVVYLDVCGPLEVSSLGATNTSSVLWMSLAEKSSYI